MDESSTTKPLSSSELKNNSTKLNKNADSLFVSE